VKEVDTPEQTVLVPVMLQTGNAFTVSVCEQELVQPLALVTVTL
jgi:hypothetical protein